MPPLVLPLIVYIVGLLITDTEDSNPGRESNKEREVQNILSLVQLDKSIYQIACGATCSVLILLLEQKGLMGFAMKGNHHYCCRLNLGREMHLQKDLSMMMCISSQTICLVFNGNDSNNAATF